MHDTAGADPEIGDGGAELWSIFCIETTKLCTHKTPQNRNKFYVTSQILTIFWKKLPKMGENRTFFARPLQIATVLQVCAGGARKFAIFSLKYSHRAIQNGGRGANGGGLAPPPLDPPLRNKIAEITRRFCLRPPRF